MIEEMKKNLAVDEHWFTTTDDVNLHYVHYGSGAPLIIIPGWSNSWETFLYNLPELGKTASVYILESRGHGLSDAPAYGRRIARLSKDALEFIDHLGFEKADWLGHSMGCSVLWSFIELFGQDRIRKLILVDQPSSLLINPFETQAEGRAHGGTRMDIWQILNGFSRSWEEGSLINDTYINRDYYRQFENPEKAEFFMDLRKLPKNREFLGNLLFDHQTRDWRDLIPRITVPTLLISGDVGHVTTVESCEWIANAIKGCKWVRFSKEEFGTHMLLVSNSEKFNKEVSCFITG